MKKLFLVDAYALIYRNYYAFIANPMRNKDGINTSAIFGFTKFMRDIIHREQPHYIGVAFDPKGPTFRHTMYPLYKANRTATPEDIHISVPYIKRILEGMCIPVLEVAGYEADDVIGTLAHKAEKQGFEVFMVSPDKDFGQLVTHHTHIYKQGKSGEGFEIIGYDKLKENYGISDPRHIIDILALWGDASDNIPGVVGIGEKGAIKLVNAFGTVESILEQSDKLSGKQRENIINGREQLLLSKKLATIDQDVPIDFDPETLVMVDCNTDKLRAVYQELGFSSFIREMNSGKSSPFGNGYHSGATQPDTTGSPTVDLFSQPGSLFDGSQANLFSSSTLQNPEQVESAEPQYETALSTPHTYTMVRTAEELSALVAALSTQEQICFDTETTGLDVLTDKIVGISFAAKPFEAYYIPFSSTTTAIYADILRPLLENPSIAKIGQNIKFDIMVLRQVGITVRGFLYDTMILHYLLDPDNRHGMDLLSRTFLDYAPIEITSLIGRGAKQLTMDMIPPDKVCEYAAEDADVTLRLKEILWPKIQTEGFEELYRGIEEPLINVLADIELTGVKIDTNILARSGSELGGELAAMEGQIREMVGMPNLNVNSAKQLGEALFLGLKLDPKPKMTKTKQFCTDEEYLQSLSSRHPVVEVILEYRGLKKLLSTYVDALPQLVNKKTGRVHTSFNQAVAATGRLSSSNPNLQNIPIRDARGREIRRAFIPTSSDYVLLSADYSQVELRIMAHLSGDSAMVEAFRQKEDIHAATAARLFGLTIQDVTSDQRRKAKTVNFGIIYGISAFGLSQRLNIPRTEAKQIIDGYFASYPGIKQYMDRVVADGRETGYVATIFGRKRYLKDINSRNAIARGLAERNAINAPIQGSAADIIKMAMIKVFDELERRHLRSKLILQVHDELIIDLYRPEQEVVTKIVVEAMESAASLAVALTVDYSVGDNWLEAH